MNKSYIGIFLVSLATLALEISLIRFFSVSQWYHFAFMIVSIALFGIAASGTFLSIKKLKNPLFISSVLFSVSILVGFFVSNKVIFNPYEAVLNPVHVFTLLVYYLFLGLPFFFFGIIIAFMFSKHQKQAGKIYFYNLLGSAIGALIALFFISYFHTKAIVVISFIGLIASFFFIDHASRFTYKQKLVIALVILHLLLLFVPFQLNLSKYKELNQALNVPGSKLIDTRYNSFSRVDIVESSFTRYAPGLSPAFDKTLPEQIGITIDGSNMNAITKHEKLDFIDNLPSSVPYFLTDNKKTLVINSGAGLDVLAALKHNATVTAVEANPIVIDLLKNEYMDFSGNIYTNVVWGEGRSFVKDTKERYDIIVISLAGNVLSGAAGISGLSENYLLTREAFQDYHNALNDDGVLIITRWLLFPPRESLRLFSLALEIDPKAENTALFRSWTTVTLIVSKDALDEETINKLKAFADSNKFDIIYLPTEFVPNKNMRFKEPYYYNAVQNLLQDKDRFYDEYVFDVTPVTDDKPFYFNFFKLSKFKQLYNITEQRLNLFFDSGFLLFFILLQAIILSLVFILLPIRFFHKKRITKKPLGYFFAIGLGFLFIEIVLIQKFILFLGHVAFSSSAIIFSVLLFSSIGAWCSQKYKRLGRIVLVLFALTIFYLFLLDPIISSLISLDLVFRIIISVLLAAPLGFFMGFPFPLGIRAVKKELIPWAWAVNGSASVLSPLLAIILALAIGYNLVLLIAGIIYLIGVLFMLRNGTVSGMLKNA